MHHPVSHTVSPFHWHGWPRALRSGVTAAVLAGAALHSVAAPGGNVEVTRAAVTPPNASPSVPRSTGTLTLEEDAARIAANVRAAMAEALARQRTQPSPPPRTARAVDAHTARQAATQGHGDAHWTYGDGPHGPAAWGKLAPAYSRCATGQRQSPIAIDDSLTLQGPAEPLLLDHRPSGGSVLHTGHTLQVELAPGNGLTVRGRRYELVQFHFHHPAEEKINQKGFAMVAHLVHRDAEGALAVLAVLLEPGAANPLIELVWTHLPLEAGDRVPVPTGLIDLAQLMPQDPRYYQFMGSLTTPPCTEGVLWMVMQQPVTLSPEQLRLFARLFPHNARPAQPLNGRVVRQAM
ncbi:MAG: carbonic anhydrase family protein [Hydrogenophaga sp.]|nr:carbonic anhydrase family protein [Hydrogenophaga sp.]